MVWQNVKKSLSRVSEKGFALFLFEYLQHNLAHSMAATEEENS
jgi:hypothetical protein